MSRREGIKVHAGPPNKLVAPVDTHGKLVSEKSGTWNEYSPKALLLLSQTHLRQAMA